MKADKCVSSRTVCIACWCAVGAAALCLLHAAALPAWSRPPAAGEDVKIAVGASAAESPLVFRYCPKGSITPGRPKPPPIKGDAGKSEAARPASGESGAAGGLLAGALAGGPVDIDPYYLLETELSIQQLAAILGDEAFGNYAARIRATNASAPDIIEHIDAKAPNYPALGITLADALRVCRRLEEMDLTSPDPNRSPLEQRRFRMPSHAEWQYACRAVLEDRQAAPLPYFNAWPEAGLDALDKNVRSLCDDEWKALGENPLAFQGSQQQIAVLIERRLSDANTNPLAILTACLRASVGLDRDFAQNKPGVLRAQKSDRANRWKLHDMHEGVREWTIAIADRGELNRAWDQLAAAPGEPSDSAARFVLAGGSFADIMTGSKTAWMKFTIWGGAPADPATGDVLPFSVKEAFQGEVVNDHQPGLRILMDRVLAEHWLLAVRQETVAPPALNESFLATLEKFHAQLEEIVPQSQQKQVFARLGYYQAIGLYRLGRRGEASRMLESLKAELFPVKKKFDLSTLDITGGGNSKPKPADAKPAESEDQMFVGLLQGLMAEDAPAQ